MIYVIITIDVEVSERYLTDDRTEEFNNMIYGNVKGAYYGFPKIMEICKKYEILSTFFLDVFEEKRYGESQFIKVCEQIKSEGFDLQLHVHPSRAYDLKRPSMWQYSLEEQIEIIKDGKQILSKWIGEQYIAYRGGNFYGIDHNTFTALKENNIRIDSSSFYGHENCKAVVTKNKVVEYNSIIEVPVTVFQRNSQIKFLNRVLWQKPSIIKTDINSASLDELKWFVRQAKEHDIKVMNLFMHSYSFLKFDRNFSHFKPDWDDIEKFDVFLRLVTSDPEIQIITMKQFYDLYKTDSEQFIGSDYVPIIENEEQFNPIKHGAKFVMHVIKKMRH